MVVIAMAAGTPVLTYGRGSMPELIQNGETGYLVENEEEMVEMTHRVATVDRARCRSWVQERFSEQMVEGDNFIERRPADAGTGRATRSGVMPGRAWNLKRLRSESGYWRSCILITAAHLDLFGWIGKQEKSPRALTAHFGGVPPDGRSFSMRLCSMGLLRKRGGKYANGAFAARCLSRGGAISTARL